MDGYVTISCKNGAEMLLPELLATKLGVSQVIKGDIHASLISNINHGVENMHILSNLLDNQLIGDTSAKVLATIPIFFRVGNFSDALHFEVANIKPKLIHAEYTSKLVFNLVSTDMEPVKVLGGNITLTLKFSSHCH